MNSKEFVGVEGRGFIERFSKFTHCDEAALLRAVEFYNRDFSAYGNEVYADLPSRVAHWANFLDQGWFQHRLDLPLLLAPDFDVVLDLGFSVPYAFATPHLREHLNTRYVFADLEASCQVFFNSLVEMEGWQAAASRSRILLADIEREQGRAAITEVVQALQPRSLLVVASEVLEHLTDTKPVWHWLTTELSALPLEHTAIYLTLPIGRRIPSHTLEIRTAEDAVSWVNGYLPSHSGFVISAPGKPSTPYLEAAYCAWAQIQGR
jgi:hypothetical protein